VGPVPADIGGAGNGGPALQDVDAVHPYPVTLEAEGGRRVIERLAVGDALVDVQPSEAVGPRVLPEEMEVSRDHAVDVVVLEIERVEEVGHRTALHGHPRVDLLATVGPRITDRELPAHVHARQTGA